MQGQCLCGQVVFEFTPQELIAFNCFCTICQRSHGALFATVVPASKSSLRFLAGEHCVKRYSSSAYANRVFCGECGSRLYNYADEKVSDYMSVSLACVTSDHSIVPSVNVQTASRALWYTPCNTLQSFDEFPRDFARFL